MIIWCSCRVSGVLSLLVLVIFLLQRRCSSHSCGPSKFHHGNSPGHISLVPSLFVLVSLPIFADPLLLYQKQGVSSLYQIFFLIFFLTQKSSDGSVSPPGRHGRGESGWIGLRSLTQWILLIGWVGLHSLTLWILSMTTFHRRLNLRWLLVHHALMLYMILPARLTSLVLIMTSQWHLVVTCSISHPHSLVRTSKFGFLLRGILLGATFFI